VPYTGWEGPFGLFFRWKRYQKTTPVIGHFPGADAGGNRPPAASLSLFRPVGNLTPTSAETTRLA
jgi:hypothetical protein